MKGWNKISKDIFTFPYNDYVSFTIKRQEWYELNDEENAIHLWYPYIMVADKYYCGSGFIDINILDNEEGFVKPSDAVKECFRFFKDNIAKEAIR